MHYRFDSPFGAIDYEWDGNRCDSISLLPGGEGGLHDDPVSLWLSAYFAHQSLPLPPLADAATPFQARMRSALLAIPPGEVRTYGELAAALATSPRALGQALGANPLPLMIPCHRVIAADGLGGFSAGLKWKQQLLNFERGQ